MKNSHNKFSDPPRVSQWIMKHFFPDDKEYSTIGDLEEVYHQIAKMNGRLSANWWYRIQLIKSFKPLLSGTVFIGGYMISNYFKIAFRNLKKQKLFSAITILGLAIGMAASILLMLFVKHELSYDNFHTDADRIYRVITQQNNHSGQKINMSLSMGSFTPVFRDQPSILGVCRLYDSRKYDFNYEKQNYLASKIFYADSGFFNVFSFDVLEGDRKQALHDATSMVITKSLAKRIFGDQNPINKRIEYGGIDYYVSTVINDIPLNSHFSFEILLPLDSFKNLEQLRGNEFYTYFKIDKKVSVDKTLDKLEKSCNEILKFWQGIGYTAEVKFQPLLDIHLYSDNFAYEIAGHGNISSVYIFLSLSLLVIIIAILNHANLFTAKSYDRLGEIGLRKAIGGDAKSITIQFLGESVFVSLIAIFLGLVIVYLFIDIFGDLVGRKIVINQLECCYLVFVSFVVAILVGIAAGFYPAFYLSKVSAKNILTNKDRYGQNNTLISGTVLVQFTIVIVLISLVTILYNQVQYMKEKDLGFNKSQTLVFDYNSFESYQALKARLLENVNIESVTASRSVPGKVRSGQIVYIDGENPEATIPIYENRVQDDFVKTYGIEIIKGRDFNKELISDNKNLIVNETAINLLGLNVNNAVGTRLKYNGMTKTIIGIMKDYHFASMHSKVEALMLSRNSNRIENVTVQLKLNNLANTINFIENTVKEFNSKVYFNYYFMNERFDQMYNAEERKNQLFISFSILAVFLALLGLFALTSLTIVRRTKEIAVRKVLGANVTRIIFMLIREFMKWVLIANIIAWPIAWYVGHLWLEDFAFRISITPQMFLFAGFTTLVLAISSIIFITYRAANANPIDSIKYE